VSVADDPRILGQWSTPFSLPSVAIHAHLLPDGQILFWGRRNRPEDSLDIHQTAAYVLNPNTLQSTPTAQPSDVHGRHINLFCSGHNFLPDGRLFVAGGHFYDAIGLSQACIYDYKQDKWQAIHPMNEGRWYPTCIQLTHGSMLTFSGSFALEILLNGVPQVWNGSNWINLKKFTQKPPLYPRMHAMSGGKVFMSGPLAHSFVLDTNAPGDWQQIALRSAGNRDYAPSVEYEPGKIVFIGGGNDKELAPGEEPNQPTNVVESIDLNSSPPTWTTRAPMKWRRRQHNATLLPDGTVLVTGGTQGGGGPQKGFNDLRPGQPVHSAEIWDPTTDTWTEVAAESVDRCYHAVNLLLPDGRVLSAGGGEYRPNELVDTVFKIENDPKDSHRDAQIFLPPYLFKGERPKITKCPASIQPGLVVEIECSQSKLITAVTLIKLPSVTHSFNQSQCVLQLKIENSNDTSITIGGPREGSFVPGHYMVFLLNKERIPSIARIVLVGDIQQAVQSAARQALGDRLLIKSLTPVPPQPKAGNGEIEITVGLTPTCPYGLAACWGAAFEALTGLSGNPTVGDVPDKKFCTATLLLQEKDLLKTFDWPAEFQKVANASYDYRGIELTAAGGVLIEESNIFLQLENGQKFLLKPLEAEHKIQWNIKTESPCELLPAERLAFSELQKEITNSPKKRVHLTGPLVGSLTQPIMEVRQYWFLSLGQEEQQPAMARG
jgi:galactose oxidase